MTPNQANDSGSRPNPVPAADAIPPRRRRLFGIWFDALTLDEAVARCMAAADAGELLEIGVVNAAKLVKMRRDQALHDAVTGCHMVVADGQSLVWASRLLGAALPARVAGIDLFQALLSQAERTGKSVYFLGARDEVLAEMVRRMRSWHPALRIAGSHHGYFGDDQAPQIADQIAASDADMLFLGMTSPKKENFVAAYGKRSGASVVHGVGGAFDVMAGLVRRAPGAWQRAGMEWLYRALQEPRRLGPRYLTTNVAFAGLLLKELVRRRPAGPTGAGGTDR